MGRRTRNVQQNAERVPRRASSPGREDQEGKGRDDKGRDSQAGEKDPASRSNPGL